MAELRFDGRVALVTGGARGIGLGYCRLLASRGASVVVADLERELAEQAAVEIGDSACATAGDVGVLADAERMVAEAIERFGRLDVLINNAGIVSWSEFPTADPEILERELSVHVRGSFNMTRAAWPHLAESGAGRIVMTTSSSVYGLPMQVAYAPAKAALISMIRVAALGGAAAGIKANAVAPNAQTTISSRMLGLEAATSAPAQLIGVTAPRPPEFVANLVAYLVHETCPVSGEIYYAGSGRVARMFVGETRGYVDPDLTPEDVRDHWAEVNDEAGYFVPGSTIEWNALHESVLRDAGIG